MYIEEKHTSFNRSEPELHTIALSKERLQKSRCKSTSFFMRRKRTPLFGAHNIAFHCMRARCIFQLVRTMHVSDCLITEVVKGPLSSPQSTDLHVPSPPNSSLLPKIITPRYAKFKVSEMASSRTSRWRTQLHGRRATPTKRAVNSRSMSWVI